MKSKRQEQKRRVTEIEKNTSEMSKLKTKLMQENDSNTLELAHLHRQQTELEEKLLDIEGKVQSSYIFITIAF